MRERPKREYVLHAVKWGAVQDTYICSRTDASATVA